MAATSAVALVASRPSLAVQRSEAMVPTTSRVPSLVLRRPTWTARARPVARRVAAAAQAPSAPAPTPESTSDAELLGTSVTVRNLSKVFVAPNGSTFNALTDCSLDIEPGEFVALLGPSGDCPLPFVAPCRSIPLTMGISPAVRVGEGEV